MTERNPSWSPELEESVGGYEWLRQNSQPIPNQIACFGDPPKSVEPFFLRCENQGSMGSCRGHSLSTGAEYQYWVASGGKEIQLSPMWCYLETQRLDGLLGRDAGSTISNGIKLAQSIGVCTEASFPYPNPVRYSTNIPNRDKLLNEAKGYRFATTCVEIDGAESAYRWIGSGAGHIDVGCSWGSWADSAVIESFGGGGGGHAWVIVGYSERRETRTGLPYFWMFNSWGRGWGRDGWKEISPTAINQMRQHQYTAMVGVTDMVDIAPRKFAYTDSDRSTIA